MEQYSSVFQCLQSETAGLSIPEIELELNPGTLGGRFTTLEGILNQVYEELDDKVFARGDSAVVGEQNAMGDFLAKLKQVSWSVTPPSVFLLKFITDDPTLLDAPLL